MHRFYSLISIVVFIFILNGCNTLYHSRVINIEIAVPGRVKFPPEFKSTAIRYNNSNVSSNKFFSTYFKNRNPYIENKNLDSIASEVYFRSFVETLQNQFFFNHVKEIEPFDYSNFYFEDSLVNLNLNDTSSNINATLSKFAVSSLIHLIKDFESPDSVKKTTKIIDPEFGLYLKDDIKQIADTTRLNLLFSLDFFGAIDGVFKNAYSSTEAVYIFSFWNIYDLQKNKLLFFYDKVDTVEWKSDEYSIDNIKEVPKREDAVLLAAEIAGSKFAEFLIPHWTEVQRMYYKSGNVELRKAEELIKNGEWLKAAEIWKNNINNKNKKIAAKSMFNLALANEMEGDLDAAIDWAVKSFHVFNQKNEIHYWNCLNYIQILGQRKLDIKNINLQMNAEISNSREYKNE